MKIPAFVFSVAVALAPATAQLNCTDTLFGEGCGPTLDITWTPQGNAGNQRITLDAAGLDPDGITMMVWGRDPINVPLPFGGCPMFTEFLWGHNINPLADGTWSWSRSWPASVPGFYYIQLGTLSQDSFGEVHITSSQAKFVSCL